MTTSANAFFDKSFPFNHFLFSFSAEVCNNVKQALDEITIPKEDFRWSLHLDKKKRDDMAGMNRSVVVA